MCSSRDSQDHILKGFDAGVHVAPSQSQLPQRAKPRIFSSWHHA
jgi:hypothetical protein